MRSKIADIQKDMILFFIILVFLLCFFFWLAQPKEGFFNNVIQPTPVFEALDKWTNSVIENKSLSVKWRKIKFDTTDKYVKPSKNSEFSLTFWLFLKTPNETPKPIFRIWDSSTNKNSPGVWLKNNQIRIKINKKTYQTIQIPQQSVNFYTIVFRPYDYSLYINGDLEKSEAWGGTPIEIQNKNAIVEFASAVTDNHYLVTDIKMYSEVFTQDTVVKLYTDSKDTVGLPST
jgi:hypothetical protein